ncbi:hypothetical protein RYX56_23935, partial [Alkalihalophilus lindianensis]
GKYVDSEDYFHLLAEKISASGYLQQAEIYIDGFYSFSPQEYQIIQELATHCKRVTIALTTDRPSFATVPDELDLFRASNEICST